MDELKALIELMAKALVDKPDDVSVRETDGEKTTIIELRVAQDDLGKVIGKQGRTARSMRTILVTRRDATSASGRRPYGA